MLICSQEAFIFHFISHLPFTEALTSFVKTAIAAYEELREVSAYEK